tara:strand:- start:282 stop:1163 length:882 start_codon:yes stop_codon:yes gene_type:complete
MLGFYSRKLTILLILAGYFFLAFNIAVEKWLLEKYSLYEINFITAASFMIITAIQEFFTNGSLKNIRPFSWKILILISLFTLGAWHFFLTALKGLSVFEFGSMSLLSPVITSVLATFFLRERPSFYVLPAIILGIFGGYLMMDGEWNGFSSAQYHLFMIFALLFSSLRWIVVKHIGDKIPTSALIFWEPSLVLISMAIIVDLGGLWDKITLILFASGGLLFISRQLLVRSYQNRTTTATSISSLIYTKLLWTLLFGYWFWNNIPKPIELIGVLLIIFSSMLVIIPSLKFSKSI